MSNPQEITVKKEYKQTPEDREYFKLYHRNRRKKLLKCHLCGEQADYKSLDTLKPICEGCIVKTILQKNKEKQQCPAPT